MSGIALYNNIRFISINWGTHTQNIMKTDIEVKRESNIVFVKDDIVSSKLSYLDITTPTFASAVALETALLLWANTGAGCGGCGFSISERFETFISIAGQVTFTPTQFLATQNSPVYVNGYLTVENWTCVSGAVVFSVAPPTGSVVVIENPNNIIIEKTVQVYVATPAQTTFITVFQVSPNSIVTQDGYKMDYGVEWNIVGVDVVMVVPCVGGEVVVIAKA